MKVILKSDCQGAKGNGIVSALRVLLILLLVNFLMPAYSYAQRIDRDARPGKLKRLGDRAFRNGDLDLAARYYSAYLDQRPKDAHRAYRVAGIKRMQGRYEGAAAYYKMVLETVTSRKVNENYIDDELYRTYSEKYPLARFYFAQMLKSAKHYDSAIVQFNEFIREYGGRQQKFYHKLARVEMEGCYWLRDRTVPEPEVTITALPEPEVRSTFVFGAVMDAGNTILAHSFQVNFVSPEMAALEFTMLKWKLRKNKREDSIPVKVRAGTLVTKTKASIAGSISADGKRIYCQQCDIKVNYAAEMGSLQFTYLDNCALYTGSYKTGQAGPLTRLNADINRFGYRNLMPSVCLDTLGREILYFVSDRPGGYGGLDIWYSIYSHEKKDFLPAVNAGKEVNTGLDEVSPFYSPDSAYLYFSTNGRAGKGAFDIFRIQGEPGNWQSPLNMVQFNSPQNDWYFVTDRKEQFGYYTTVASCKCMCCGMFQYFKKNDPEHMRRQFGQTVGIEELGDGSNCYNIVRFQYPVKGYGIRTYAVSANDPKQGYLEDVKLRLYRAETYAGNMLNQVDNAVLRNKQRYFHTVQPQWYILRLEKEGFETKDTLLKLDTLTQSDTLEFRIAMRLAPPPKTIVLTNVFFDFDDARLNRESKRALDSTLLKFLELNPTKKVLILSHTDSKGNDEYNLELSQRRAENIKEYLRKRGIDPRRMEARGYGAAHPVAPNNHKDGSDNPEGRALNRRTEFRVIGEM